MSYVASAGAQAIKRVLRTKAKRVLTFEFDSHHFLNSMSGPGTFAENNKIGLSYHYQNREFRLALFEKGFQRWIPHFEVVWHQEGELTEKARLLLEKVLKRSYATCGAQEIEIVIRRMLVEEFNLNS